MKTICIYHSRDLDGWMSAAIVKHWFIKLYKEHKVFERKVLPRVDVLSIKGDDISSLEFLGWDYGNPIPDLSKYDKIIMCDISFPKEKMQLLIRKCFEDNFKSDFIWIDHHVSAINQSVEGDVLPNGLRDTKFAACELTWQYFFPNEPMPEIVRLLGRYDCFGHKGTDEEQKVLEFQYGARACMSNYEECYEKLVDSMGGLEKVQGAVFDTIEAIQLSGGDIYDYLCTEAKQTYSKTFRVDILNKNNPNHEIDKPIFWKFLCVNQERFNPINFGIDYHNDGYDGFACFHYEKGKWCFSLYSDNHAIDVSLIAKQFGGGGHKGASGFVCDNETMLKIINNET